MTDRERANFGEILQGYWPMTSTDAALLVLRECEQFGIEAVKQAMSELRIAMPGHHQMIDSARMLAICRRITGTTAESASAKATLKRTADYLSEQNAWGEKAKELNQALEAMHVDPADMQRAFDACAIEYDAAWNGFGPRHKARLMKLWLMEGFPPKRPSPAGAR